MTTESSGLAIRRLQESGSPDGKTIDRFIREQKVFPIVEGPCATFVWRGHADAVHLRHWIYGLASSQAFQKIEGTDVWFLIIELPHGSRVEYKLEIVRGDGSEWIEDPLNPLKAHDPFGTNSVLHGNGYAIPEWSRHDPETRPGEIKEIKVPSKALGGERAVTLYLPARFRATRAYQLLVAHDGGDYLKYSGLKTVLDNLIHRLEIPPMVVAFTHPQDRLVEYANHAGHAAFLSEELVPWLEERLPLESRASARGLMGASFGAVASFSTAWRHPDVWGALLLQSGSFAFTDIGENRRGPKFQPVVDFVNAFRDRPTRVAERLFVSCGIYESLIYENRSLVPLLQSTGMEIRYAEARDGHNWENWRDRSREGLSWLFPGPLWMVYE